MSRVRTEEQDRAEQEFGQGDNPKPTKAPLQRREASPAKYATSGMERALGELADKTHKC
jgi:hypothetical protein